MAAERQESLREFVAVTGTEEDRARFFLESAGWDLQVALRGGLCRAGRGLRVVGAWHVKPMEAEAHSHPARPRPDRPQGPVAACHASSARLRRGKTLASPGPDRLCLTQFPLLPRRSAGPARLRVLPQPAWTGAAWGRGGRAESRRDQE